MFLQKLINGFLFIYFLLLAIQTPSLNAQIILPIEFFPKFLIDLVSKYIQENNDYLISEKPHFRVGLAWVELILYWPLAIANVYGLLNKRSWVKKTCLIYGVSASTNLVAILSELIGSGKGSPKLVSNFYGPFMIATVICILNGLTTTTSSSSTRTPMPRKKRV
ncbi:hypothetical protein C5167_019974 [Papaver somniferum]|uniref:EXPERA domain-containing protein n=1 Tax=Papaver somniferum TaxID=3469 RepID=A0A4Y7IS76_PAPSO|nr:uncharacterized protein LOC113354055 [Papaver somniferum]RZC51547.1 hypothetical protein C5167_019974 [Papaver somniferum]